jgi:enamine deaminase RidA (YjgF/YER057c/UK114 family)
VGNRVVENIISAPFGLSKDCVMQGTRIFTASPWEEKAGFARAVAVDDWVFVSGTTGADPKTRVFPDDPESQCENCFATIKSVLAEAESSLDDIVRVLIFVSGPDVFEKILPIIRKHTYAARPANTTVFAQMVGPQMHVEIEVMAKRRARPTVGNT